VATPVLCPAATFGSFLCMYIAGPCRVVGKTFVCVMWLSFLLFASSMSGRD